MKKLIILLVFIIIVCSVYMCFMLVKDKQEEKIKEDILPTKTMKKDNQVNTIDYSYQSICLSYIRSIEYQIEIDVLNGKSIPESITDPNYTSSKEIPETVNLEVNNKGIVEKGTVTYEHVICNYENGIANLGKRTN